jgi:hypothetical protein
MRFTFLAALLLSAALMFSCQGGYAVESTPSAGAAAPVSAAQLKAFLGLRLFFGHQSVGYNILDGLRDVFAQRGVEGPTVVEGRAISAQAGPALHHATIGENGDPLGKIHDFDSIMRAGAAGQVDVAFMKLCYVDVSPATDVRRVFDDYKAVMAGLHRDYPKALFLHMTVPLTSQEKGPKALARRLLGRQVRGYADNAARESLNALLRAEYGGTGLLFDLALAEATGADGTRQKHTMDGKGYYAMQAAYTDDGGHLNARGRVHVAEELLAFLCHLPAR